MRLYSLSVLYKGDPKVHLLKAAYDVSTFNFFQRSRWGWAAAGGWLRSPSGRRGSSSWGDSAPLGLQWHQGEAFPGGKYPRAAPWVWCLAQV